MSTIAAYIRVSTREQKLDGQRHEVQRYLESQGFEDVRWFRDRASGKNVKRPDFERLQTEIGRRRIKTVVVWKLDRAFRNALDCLRTVEEWDGLGVSLRIIDLGGQPIDTKSAAGKFMLTVVAAVAEMERANARERQKVGIDAARKKNNGKCPWGGSEPGRRYRLTSEKERTILRLSAAGEKIASIARITGLCRPTIYRVMRNQELVRNGA